MAGRDRARRSRESGSAVFAGAVSSREIRQRIAPSGGIPTIPAPLPLCRGSRPTVRTPRHARRACRRAREHSWTRARRRQRISPPLPSPRTRPMSNSPNIPGRVDILATEASHLNRRAQTSDARRRDGQGGGHPPLHPPSRHAAATVARSASSTPLGSDDDDTAKEDGDATSSSSPPSLPLLPDLLAPVPGANRARGEEPSSTAPATKETEGRVDAAGGGFSTRRVPRGGRDDAFRDSLFVRRGRRRRAAPPRFPPRRRGDCPERECASRTRVRRPSRGRGGRFASGNGISRSGARGAGYLPAPASSCASGVTRTFARVFCGAGGWRTPTPRVHFSI